MATAAVRTGGERGDEERQALDEAPREAAAATGPGGRIWAPRAARWRWRRPAEVALADWRGRRQWVTWHSAIGWEDMAGGADIVRRGEDASGGAREGIFRVSSTNLEGLHIFIGRGS